MAAEALIVEDAYQRGYADAIADMRKKKEQRRQREQAKKACRWYFIKQKAYAGEFRPPAHYRGKSRGLRRVSGSVQTVCRP